MKLSLTLLILLSFIWSESIAQNRSSGFENKKLDKAGDKLDSVLYPFISTYRQNSNLGISSLRLNERLKKYSLINLADNYSALQKNLIKSEHITMQMPADQIAGKRIILHKSQLTTTDFFVRTSDGITMRNIKSSGNHFYGNIENEPRSLAAFSFNKSGIKGVISDVTGNNVIEPIPQSKYGEHIVYNELDVLDKQPFSCQTLEDEIFKRKISEQIYTSKPAGNTCKTVKIYIECTYAMFLAHNSNINEVIDFVFSFFNVSAVLFKNDGINVQISEMFIWNQPDIYSGINFPSTLALVMRNRLKHEFDIGNKVIGDVAHLITPLNFGGGASTIGINNCGQPDGFLTCAASSLINPFFQLPVFSKTIYIFTHETGHLLGSPHTQSCSWPGGAIDNCAITEGGCAPGPAPVNGGTIMSYCNLTPYGINFLNGFGPLPSALIKDQIERNPCISLCVDTICGNMKLKDVEATISSTTLKLKWLNEVSKYRIGLKPNTTAIWQYYEVLNTDSFVLTKTNCESLYEYSIAPFCASLNKYGTKYSAFIGDSLAIHLKLNPGNSISLCAGDSTLLSVDPDSNFVYNWYINGLIQPQFNTRTIYAKQIGNYKLLATINGCTFYSDTVKILRAKQNPRIVPTINGLSVDLAAFYNCSKTILWDLGDGTQASISSLTHIYTQPGIYNISLKVWDADGNMEQVQRRIDLFDEYVDSLNGFSQYGLSNAIKFNYFSCRNTAIFTADSLDINNSATILSGPSIRYFQNSGNSIFESPKTGTIEFKLFPKRGLVKLRGNLADVLESDTGYVLNTSVTVTVETNKFFLFFSKWGGLQVAVDSVVMGNIANGIQGPLRMNQWNNIGISYGDQGIQVMLNGQLFASDPHIIDSAHASLLGRFNFGSYVGRIGYGPTPLYFKSFEGALDLVRLSHKQHDFTFSGNLAWQGTDTVTINKQICSGGNYLEYTSTGTYIRSAVTNDGCDSITRINLFVNEPILIRDSVIHPLDTSKGTIIIKEIFGAVEPLKYQWSNGDTTRNLINITPGDYILRIIDALGCEKILTYKLYKLNSNKDFIVLFPNPVSEQKYVSLRIGTAFDKEYKCIIYDVLGRKYFEQVIKVKAGVMELEIKKRLLNGLYIMHLKNGNEKQSLRFVVKP